MSGRPGQSVFVGSRSLWQLVKHELLASWVSQIPGGLGFVLRTYLFKSLFKKVGPGTFFGKDLTKAWDHLESGALESTNAQQCTGT